MLSVSPLCAAETCQNCLKIQDFKETMQIFRSSAGLSSKLLGLLGLHAEIQGLLHDI